jgi:transposase
MIPMTMMGEVRRMFYRQNKSVREIARLTSLSRNTISKCLNMEVQDKPKYQRRSQSTRLTPCHEVLVQAPSVAARRPKKVRRTAWMLFQEIKASGYDGCYSRVTVADGIVVSPGVTLRLHRPKRTRIAPISRGSS